MGLNFGRPTSLRCLLDAARNGTELGNADLLDTAVRFASGSSAASLSMCVRAASSPCGSVDARVVAGKLLLLSHFADSE